MSSRNLTFCVPSTVKSSRIWRRSMNLVSRWSRHWKYIQKKKEVHKEQRKRQTQTKVTWQAIQMSYMISESSQPCSVPSAMSLPRSWSKKLSKIWKVRIRRTLAAFAKLIWARRNRYIRFYKKSSMTIWRTCKRMRKPKKKRRLRNKKKRKRRPKLPMKAKPLKQLRLRKTKSLYRRLEHRPRRRRIKLRILSLNPLLAVFPDTLTEVWSILMCSHLCTWRTSAKTKFWNGGPYASNRLSQASILS